MSSFDGVAEVYAESRHGYPIAMRDHLVGAGALWPGASVIDLGAGTGQLSSLVTTVASDIVAIDPEPDMVRVGQKATKAHPGIRWKVGADVDILRLVDSPIDLVLIGNAFHHMDQPRLLASLDSLVSIAGTIVVCSTSIPVWLQETDWSMALREQLNKELGRIVGTGGTPDHGSDRATLEASEFSNVDYWTFERPLQRNADSIVGEVVSSASGAIDISAAGRLRSTLDPYLIDGALIEIVKTTALLASRSTRPSPESPTLSTPTTSTESPTPLLHG